MDGTLLIEVHLLAHMRASDLVDGAYRRLGLDAAAVAIYRAEADRLRLAEPGHPMDVYSLLLGPPVGQNRTADVHPYRRRTSTFILPLWPEINFVVHGSEGGQTAGVSFASPRSGAQSEVPSISPWLAVEEHVAGWPELRVVDEWYPMKDYEVVIRNDIGATVRYVLQFDYGLLQAVIPR